MLTIRPIFWTSITVVSMIAAFALSIKLLVGLALATWVLAVVYNSRRYGFLSGPTLFMLLLGLFHLGVVVPVLLLNVVTYRSLEWLSSEYLQRAVIMVILAVGAFEVGLECYVRPSAEDRRADKIVGRTLITQIWTLLSVMMVVSYFAFGVSEGILFSERSVYLELKANRASLEFGISRQLMILCVFVAISFGGLRHALLLGGLLLLALLPMFLAGNRGHFIVTGAALVVLFRKKGARINKVAIGALIATLYPLVTMVRQWRGGVEAFGPLWVDPVLEMGQQLRTVVFTIQAIEGGVTDYWLGASYAEAIARVIPNIGGIRGEFGLFSPADWLTAVFRPGGAGLGFSIVAEPYLNFGPVGVAVILWLIGFLLSWMETRSEFSPYVLAVYGPSLSALLWSVRNDFFGSFRPIVWVLISIALTQGVAALLVRHLRGFERDTG